jgi:hypothetical protein
MSGRYEHPVGSPLDLLASPALVLCRDLKKKSPSHHGLGRLGTGGAEPIRITAALELLLTGVLAMCTVRIVPIISLVLIVIEERLFSIASTIEKRMAIGCLFQTVNGRRNRPTTNGK